MNRALLILMFSIALGLCHSSAATGAERLGGTAGSELARYIKVLRRCQQVDNPILVPNSALYSLDPVGWVRAELGQNWPKKAKITAKIELAPLHGIIIEDYMASSASDGFPFYVYRPKTSFRGTDQAKISVSIDGRAFLVDFAIQVVEVTFDGKCSR